MSSRLPQEHAEKHPIAKLLDDNAITDIAIVDDAFGIPKREDFSLDEITDFLGKVDDDEDAKKEWIKFSITAHDIDDFEGIADIGTDSILKLWQLRGISGSLSELCTDYLFQKIYAKQKELETLCDFISKDLSRPIKKCCADVDIEVLGSSKLVFIDYYLSLGETTESAIEQAIAIARELFERYQPFVSVA
jgi:hypothetical protein